VWIRDARTGQVLAKRELLDASVESVSWESPTSLLVGYRDMDGDHVGEGAIYGTKILRCSTNLRDCARVPLPAKTGDSALLSRQGADPPVAGYALN
jgi:hypothetical protein